MITDSNLLSNPLNIQSTILTDYQERLDGDLQVVDANNSFMFLVESFSRLVADATVAEDAKLSGLYPIRANTTADLYNHLSDFDYVGFFSYPAPLNLQMMLHRDYLIENAIAVPDTDYKMVVIPADTVFTVGRFKLGLYYPIQIRINTLINSISASYDTTTKNPLKTLATNSIQVSNNTIDGVDLISIQFECWQFDKIVIIESVNPDIGFIKRYSYENMFYAVRVFDTSSGKKKELEYTLSDSVYDINRPTINLKVFPETNEISLSLPQIYFTSGLVGRQLQVELYSTIGAIDASLGNIQLSDITANFALSSQTTDMTYTDILRLIPTTIFSPVDARIVGGSNSYTFTQIKDFTVYHNNALSVPITRMDLDRFFAKYGFTYMAKIDNLTDRRYYAYKKLYIDNDELGVTYGGLTVIYDEDVVNSSVIHQINNTIVILPTAIFNYVTTINKLMIVDDTTATLIRNSAGGQLANILNNAEYFCNPHHIVITTLDQYPSCSLFDLMTNTAKNVVFIEENPYLSAQLSLITIEIRHLANGSGGYVVRAGMQRSEDLKDTSSDDLNCFLTVLTKEGFKVGIRGSYVGAYSGIDVFDFTISTNYKLSDTTISVTNLSALGMSPVEYNIKLAGKMYISTFVHKTLFSGVGDDNVVKSYLTSDDNSWLSISLQSFDYVLGSNLNDVIDPNLLTNWTNVRYKTYDANVQYLYEHDVYQLNPDGTIEYTVDTDGKLVTTKLHSIGNPVLDNDGNPVLKHHIGDVVTDAGGIPVQVQSRMKDFTINLSAYEYGRMVVTTDFLITLSASLSAYYDVIRAMSNDVLENTDIYFNPIVTTNVGHYKVNNSTTIESSLELEFVYNCYVSKAVLDEPTTIDALTTKIIAITTSHLSDEIISMTVIAADIKTQLGSYINSIDIVSLNGNTSIQTLKNIDIDKAPKLGMQLTVGADGRLAYTPKVTINFRDLDI